MTGEPTVRRAHPEDADAAVPLLVEALDGLALALARTTTLREAWPLFRELFVARDNRYSHQHAWVLDDRGTAVALALAYPGHDEVTLAAGVLAHLRKWHAGREWHHEPESAEDEYYLDALAVAPSHRGRGLAARMIDAVCTHAHAAGYSRTGLLVDVAKPGVRQLYERLGFKVDGERMLAGRRHDHMVRYLGNG